MAQQTVGPLLPDEQLIAYSRVPILQRLVWLDQICRFTLAVRAAPEISIGDQAVAGAATEHQELKENGCLPS